MNAIVNGEEQLFNDLCGIIDDVRGRIETYVKQACA